MNRQLIKIRHAALFAAALSFSCSGGDDDDGGVSDDDTVAADTGTGSAEPDTGAGGGSMPEDGGMGGGSMMPEDSGMGGGSMMPEDSGMGGGGSMMPDSSTMMPDSSMGGGSMMPDGSMPEDGGDAGAVDAGELDSDGDGIPDAVDPSPDDANACGDSDGDSCDDCSGGAFDPANDGADSDSDGVCDACSTEICTDNGVCVVDGEQVGCECEAAYTGDTCNACAAGYQDSDENGVCEAACTDATCSGNGTCDDASGTATCTCDGGFGGDDCSVNGCDGVTCGGAGTCSTASGAVACVCDDGYQDDDGDLTCEDVDECADNNGGCGDAAFFTCTNNVGAAPMCEDIDECAVNNGGCGDAGQNTCTNNVGGPATCNDVDECAVNNGDCGDPAFYSCLNNQDAPPTCSDIDECAVNNGDCGNAAFYTCTNNDGTAPTCADIDECAVNNGECGDAAFYTCANNDGAAPTCADIDECAVNNGECGDAAFYTCTNNVGAAPTCADIDECATNNGECGNAAFFACTNNAGAAPTCADIDECGVNNGDCGDAEFYSCTNNIGAAASCADIDECAVDNGGCGDETFFACTNNDGAEPTCEDIDECATNNGDCGDAEFYSCTNNMGAEPTCEDIDECAVNNGECGDAEFYSCTNNDGAAPTCADIDECAVNNGECGDAAFYTCTNNDGAAPTCEDIDECAVNNGECGDPGLNTCTNNDGAAPTCEAVAFEDCAAIKLAHQGAPSGVYSINPGGNGVVETYCEMTLHGGGWTLLLDQDVGIGGYKSHAEWRAGVNTATYVTGDYSLLNKLDEGEFANSSDAYAFLIDWPEDGTDFMRWEQTTNPFTSFGVLSNQVSVPVTQGSPTFQGLGPGTNTALLDGSAANNWWHAIGTNAPFTGNTIPAWFNSSSALLTASRARLWVRPSLPVSCDAVYTADPDAANGQYVIDADGPGGANPQQVQCCPAGSFGVECSRSCIDDVCPISHWPLEAGAGTVAQDFSGRQTEGTINGGVSWVADGRVAGGYVLDFDGSGAVDAVFPDIARNNPEVGRAIPTGDISFSLWFKTSAATVEGLQVVRGGGCDRIVGDSSPQLQANVWSEVNTSGAGAAAVNDDEWHQMTYVLDEGNAIILYVDGVEYAREETATVNCGPGCSGFDWATTYTFGTGANCRYGATGFTGMMDDVTLWDGPLSAAQVEALYVQEGGSLNE